ncbi:MAG: low molecular weight protein-tyrosine-phosphatase [Bacteroidota bacterium]
MIKILFVCLGNICRSPMAQGIMESKIHKKGLGGKVLTDSAGTANYHVDEAPDPRTLTALRRNGIELVHKGQQFKEAHLQEFDYVLAMDRNNLEDIQKKVGKSSKVFLMRDFDSVEMGADVPDPYYGGVDGFEKIYTILERSIEHFMQEKIVDASSR